MAEFTIAFDKYYQEVSIDDAQKGQEFICCNCNQPMIPVQGMNVNGISDIRKCLLIVTMINGYIKN